MNGNKGAPTTQGRSMIQGLFTEEKPIEWKLVEYILYPSVEDRSLFTEEKPIEWKLFKILDSLLRRG